MEQHKMSDTANPTVCCDSTPNICPLHRLTDYDLHDAKSSTARIYPAIDAFLQRRNAIKALQERLCDLKDPVITHVSTNSSCKVSSKDSTNNTGSSSWDTVVCQTQNADVAEDAAPLQPQSCDAAAAKDVCKAAACDDASVAAYQHAGLWLTVGPAQHSADTSQATDTLAVQHKAHFARKPKAPSQLYAVEFDRIRRRHQQRTAAALVIQAAVRNWLASGRIRAMHAAAQQHQEKAANCSQPHQQLQAVYASAAVCNRLDAGRRHELSYVGEGHTSPAAEVACLPVQGFSTSSSSSSICELLVRWKLYRKSVGLRCRQVLRSEGPYAMAAAYYRLRLEAAVLLWWRSTAHTTRTFLLGPG